MVSTGAIITRGRIPLFSDAKTVLPPIRRGLASLNLFQEEAKSLINFAPAGVGTEASLVGTPSWSADGMDCAQGGTHGIQTAIPQVTDYTMLWAGSTADTLVDVAHQPAVMGNYNGSSGTCIFIVNHASLAAPAARARAQAYGSANTLSSQNIVNVSAPALYAMRVRSTGGTNGFGGAQIIDLTNNDIAVEAAFTAAIVVAARNHRIGCTYSGSFLGQSKSYMGSIYNDAYLTDAELATLHTYWQGYFSDLYSVTL